MSSPINVKTTPAEAHQSLLDNVSEWRGALSPPAFFRREAILSDQDLTRNGGLTGWILTPPSAAPGPDGARPQLAACETLRKRALLARPDTGVEEVLCVGVASVFCPERERGKGYASAMIGQLATHLDGGDAAFSVLFSDIGKKFYARHGWRPMESGHVALTPGGEWPAGVKEVRTEEVGRLCARDEKLTRTRLERLATGGRNAVAILADEKTVRWQQARESFVSNELYGKVPEIQGARVTTAGGTEVWCLWTRWWYNEDLKDVKGNALHILRLVVEDPEYDDSAATDEGVKKAAGSEVAKAIAGLLQAARAEAGKWSMELADIWNPSSATLAAAQSLDPEAKVVHREKESITSLRWCDSKLAHIADDLVWTCNEKFAWC